MDDKILKSLRETNLFDRIKKIMNIYHKLEIKQQKFCDTFDIHCSENCDGSCCAHFIPDITENEAEFLAYGLIKEHKEDLVLELLRVKGDKEKYCPLYIGDSIYHCSIYKWRPLVCRLFGAAATTDKAGNPVFRKCKWNVDGRDVPEELLEEKRKMLVIMHDYEMMISEVGSVNHETYLISDILPKAIEEIRYVMELEDKCEKNNLK